MKAKPVGFNSLVITATLARAPGIESSVSRTGLASSNGRAEINLNLETQLSTSQ